MSSAAPWLHPIPPHEGPAVPVAGSPFWIGASPDAGLPLFLPGMAARHLALVARSDGYWLAPQRMARDVVRHNGHAVAEPVRLADGDVLEILPGIAYRVALPTAGSAAEPHVIAPAVPPPTRPHPPPTRPRWRVRVRAAWQRWRRRPSRSGRRGGWYMPLLVLLAGALVVSAAVLLVRALRPAATEPGPAPLADADAAEYDALTQVVADHVERGATLLEIGLPDPALREFGAAVTAMETSRLRDNVWVRPRILALEAGIAAIYRERRLPTPARYGNAPPSAAARLPALARTPRLSAADFAARLTEVQTAFGTRFGRPLVVTGRDHAEHVALYGTGSAVDLRVRDLTRAEVDFAIERLRAAGIRVKDFSTDATLRAQVAAATRAGLADRASTGLHLHADRFVDRRDRWTVP